MGILPTLPRGNIKGLAASWTFAFLASVYSTAAVWIIQIAAPLPDDRFWKLGAVAVMMLVTAVVIGFAPTFDPSLHKTEAERLLEAEHKEGDEKNPTGQGDGTKRTRSQTKLKRRRAETNPFEEDGADA